VALRVGADELNDGQPLQSAPAYLDILSATIEEVPAEWPGGDPGDVVNREVRLIIEVDAAPSCTSGSPFLTFGFLVDADRDSTTGTTDPAFGDLGIDARLCADCDPATEAFVSPLGPVTVTTDPGSGATTIEVITTVGQLPSVDFDWIAIAQEQSTLVRLPALPETGHWTTLERSLY
jgi:hypothetical protein